MLVGSMGPIPRICRWNDEDAWLVNNSGLPQEIKDKWNAIRAIIQGK
jgi:hypothetical protein